jgi:hypothetical protein
VLIWRERIRLIPGLPFTSKKCTEGVTFRE